MAVQMETSAQSTQFARRRRCIDTVNVEQVVAYTQYERHSIVATTIGEANMLTLGPHIIRHQFPDGAIEETPVRFNFLGPRETTITDGVSIIEETGEVIIELPDGEHRTFISAQNTFALVGWAIRLTEALFIGWNKEDGGKTYRLLPGDVKGPGDMFL